MISLVSFMEILILSAIPKIYSIIWVLASMTKKKEKWHYFKKEILFFRFVLRMHNIYEHVDLKWMRYINKFLEFFRCTESWWYCKWTGDVISKWTIICVLCNCHNLNSIISKLSNSRKHISSEFRESMDSRFNSSHPNMSLIDFDCMMFLWSRVLEDISLFFRRPPELAVEKMRINILNNSFAPNWYFIFPFIVGIQHMRFNFWSMRNNWLTLFI